MSYLENQILKSCSRDVRILSDKIFRELEKEHQKNEKIREEIFSQLTEKQKIAVEKAKKFGWVISGKNKDLVFMQASKKKKMTIDAKGQRV